MGSRAFRDDDIDAKTNHEYQLKLFNNMLAEQGLTPNGTLSTMFPLNTSSNSDNKGLLQQLELQQLAIMNAGNANNVQTHSSNLLNISAKLPCNQSNELSKGTGTQYYSQYSSVNNNQLPEISEPTSISPDINIKDDIIIKQEI